VIDTRPQQLALPSLGFDEDRTVLYVGEFAKRLRITEQHTIDLLEEGKLVGVDIAGRHDYVRVPATAIDALAKRTGLKREEIVETMRSAKPQRSTGRAFWRIPVKEGFEAFLRENHSQNCR